MWACCWPLCYYSYGVHILLLLKSLLIDSKGLMFCQLPAPSGVWPRTTHATASCSPDVKRRPTERSKTLRNVIIGIPRGGAVKMLHSLRRRPLAGLGAAVGKRSVLPNFFWHSKKYEPHGLEADARLAVLYVYGLLWKPKSEIAVIRGALLRSPFWARIIHFSSLYPIHLRKNLILSFRIYVHIRRTFP